MFWIGIRLAFIQAAGGGAFTFRNNSVLDTASEIKQN
jgi:hypothetical protein